MKAKLGALFALRNEAEEEKPLEILVYEDIGRDPWTGEGMDAKAFVAKLDGVRADRELNLRINSRGGDVFDGLAVYNRINEWKGRVTATIDGVAASIASVIAMAADEVRMPKSSQMFIHDAWGFAMGNAADMRDMAERLDRTSDMLAEIYAGKIGRAAGEVRGMMRESRLMTGQEAKEMGFADTLIDGDPIYNFSPEDIDQIKAMCRRESANINNGGNTTKAKEQKPMPETTAPVENKATENGAEIISLRNEIKKLTEQRDKERKDRIERAVDQCIVEDRITGNEREFWVKAALADESALAVIQAREPKPPGAKPLSAVLDAQASPDDILRHFDRFSDATRSWQRGNSVPMKAIGQNSMARAQFFAANKDRLLRFLNAGTNTIAAGLKRAVILQDVIVDFARRMMPMQAFSTVYMNVPLEGTNKVEVPFYDLDATSATSWVTATGYAAGDTATDAREIQIGNNGGNSALLCDRKYLGLSFTSEELLRQPYLNVVQLARLKAEKLAYDIQQHVLAVITEANFTATPKTVAAAAFTADDVADLVASCKTWPDTGRSLWLDTDYHVALLKDETIKTAMNYGGPEGVRQGRIPTLFGFDYYEYPNIPDNSESLEGFAVFKSAILYAQAPVAPAEEVRNAGTTYEVFTDPASGISLEYRTFGDNTLDTAKHFIEASYGFAVGNANALVRVTSE